MSAGVGGESHVPVLGMVNISNVIGNQRSVNFELFRYSMLQTAVSDICACVGGTDGLDCYIKVWPHSGLARDR